MIDWMLGCFFRYLGPDIVMPPCLHHEAVISWYLPSVVPGKDIFLGLESVRLSHACQSPWASCCSRTLAMANMDDDLSSVVYYSPQWIAQMGTYLHSNNGSLPLQCKQSELTRYLSSLLFCRISVLWQDLHKSVTHYTKFRYSRTWIWEFEYKKALRDQIVSAHRASVCCRARSARIKQQI